MSEPTSPELSELLVEQLLESLGNCIGWADQLMQAHSGPFAVGLLREVAAALTDPDDRDERHRMLDSIGSSILELLAIYCSESDRLERIRKGAS